MDVQLYCEYQCAYVVEKARERVQRLKGGRRERERKGDRGRERKRERERKEERVRGRERKKGVRGEGDSDHSILC